MRETTSVKRRRTNISIDPNIHRMGEQLAGEDHRDFSNQIEWLIQQEYRKRKSKNEGVTQPAPNGHGAAVPDINAGLVFKLPGGAIEYTMTRGPHPKEFHDDADHSQLLEAAQLWEAWRMDIEMARANAAFAAEAEEEEEE